MNALNLAFPHCWRAEVLAARPIILPARHFTYPAQAEEVERGALEVMVYPECGQAFLATCALGFRDPAVPAGIWSCPKPEECCAVSGGYAYVIDATAPERFSMIPYRPVLELLPVVSHNLLLFVGHRSILAWGACGRVWESGKLSDEGLAITAQENDVLRGRGWHMIPDKEIPFVLDLRTGKKSG